MTKLKLGSTKDDEPVKIILELPGTLHRNPVAYAEMLGRRTRQALTDPVRLIVPMLD